MIAIAQLLVSVALLALLILVLHKVRKIHIQSIENIDKTRSIYNESHQLYRQIQAYSDLRDIISLHGGLPPLRKWAASPDFLVLVARHVLRAKPRCVLECSSGSSTLVIARCLQLNGSGHVYSLEHDEEYASQTRSNLAEAGLSDWATVINAPLIKTAELDTHVWYSLTNLPNEVIDIDMIVVDGPPMATCKLARYPAMPKLIDRFSTDSVMFIDDADRQDEKIMVDRWLQEFPEWTQLQLEAEKGCVKLVRSLPKAA